MWKLTVLVLACVAAAGQPMYTAESMVSAASGRGGCLAPNMLVSLYGRNLQTPGSFATRVFVERESALVLHASPQQINFRISGLWTAGPVRITVAVGSVWGPAVPVTLSPTCPDFFMNGGFASAAHLDGGPVTPARPARPGEVVSLYGTAFGATLDGLHELERPAQADALTAEQDFQMELDGQPVAASHVLYAGIAPGFSGLYQINLRVPEGVGADPVIRARSGGVWSSAGVRLAVAAGVATGNPGAAGARILK